MQCDDSARDTSTIPRKSSTCRRIARKICAVLFTFVLFQIVLLSTRISRILIHLMIWKLNPPQVNTTTTLTRLGGLVHLVEKRAYPVLNCSADNFTASLCDSGYIRKTEIPKAWECPPKNFISCQLVEDIPSVNVMWVWGLVSVIAVPDLCTVIYSIWRIRFKETDAFDIRMLFLSLAVETFHSTGLCLLVFLVLPAFDPLTASVLSHLLVFAPVILNFLSKSKYPRVCFAGKGNEQKVRMTINSSTSRSDREIKLDKVDEITRSESESSENFSKASSVKEITNNKIVSSIVRVFSILSLLMAYGFSIGYINEKAGDNVESGTISALLIVSSVLVSFNYWENFLIFSSPIGRVGEKSSGNCCKTIKLKSFLSKYTRSKKEKVLILTMLWKITLTVVFPYMIFSLRSSGKSINVAKAISFMGSAKIRTLTGEVVLESRSYISYGCHRNDVGILLLITNILGFICFLSTRFACRVNLQMVCFSVPLMMSLIATPFVFIPVIKYPLDLTADFCNVAQPLWGFKVDTIGPIMLLMFAGVFGSITCILLTLYIWRNSASILDKNGRQFVKPSYCGIFLDLSLLLTRNQDIEQTAEKTKKGEEQSPKEEKSYYPFVYLQYMMRDKLTKSRNYETNF
ncbi:uncharacterized protein LOC133173338 [Saccostrea echinata]|uniref:uncharacterized protein LOC133173338 n=1 Tax=Saccostrea echinata TaxID=191078 RepID=UPI002A82013D|nr:uncharacterized protein LOC133173338 [Saccostrea echinata]